MGENTLSVKITADVVDLQTKFVTAKAEVSALTKEMNDLAKQSAAGVLDPAGLAQLQDVSRQFLEAKRAASELKEEMAGIHESSEGLGGALEEIKGKITNAFEVTGIAVAYEGIMKLGEAIESLGERATQMRAMSDILGVTVEQFQAMSAAAEEGGTSVEVFARASERLITLLTQAREGSGAAREKLYDLGVALNQINDPAFKVNDLLQILHDRLLDSATSQSTMNELIKEFGPRAAMAAEAFKSYDGSAAGVSATMNRLNGLTDEQTHKLHEMATAAKEAWTWITNAASKVLSLGGIDAAKEGVGKWAEKDDDASKSGAAQKELQREQQAQELQNIQAGIEAYKQGTERKLEQLRIFRDATSAFYGADSDKALAAQRQEIAGQRAFDDAQASLRAEQVRATIAADDNAVKEKLAGIKLVMLESERALQKQQEDETKSLQITREQMRLDDQAAALRLKSISLSISESERFLSVQQRDSQLFQQRWSGAFHTFQGAFSSAIDGMLRGGETFGEAMRGVFASIAESALQNAVKNIATMAMQAVFSDSIRAGEIKKDAGAAAAGAYKAVVGIPYIGPFLAPAAAAVAYAGVLAFESAEGGYDIPSGVNPVVQTHAREMILPQRYGDVIRGLADDGGSGANRKGSSVVHIHGKSSDKVTVDQVVAMMKSAGYRFKLV